MDKLGIDPKLLIAQLINFGLFFLIFRKFIAKPFLSFIKDQEKKDKQRLVFEEHIKQEKEKTHLEEIKAKERMNAQIKETINSAKKEAEVIKKGMIEQAKKEAEDVLVQAKRQIEEESRLATASLRQKAADLSLIVVKQSLKDYLTEDMQKGITRHILSQIKN